MKVARHLLSWALLLAGALLVSCKSGSGPLLINVSGESAQLLIHGDKGAPVDGACGDQAAVWVGRSGVRTIRVEIQLAGARHVLEGEELETPLGRDETTAFVIEAAGPRKLTLREAEMIMRNRPRIDRPR